LSAVGQLFFWSRVGELYKMDHNEGKGVDLLEQISPNIVLTYHNPYYDKLMK